MRIRIIAAALLLTLAGCGTAEPGKDIAGNQVAPAGTSAASTAAEYPLETSEDVTGAGADEEPSQAAVPVFRLGESAVVHRDTDGASGLITVASPKVWRRPTSAELGSRPKHGRFLRLTVTASATTGVFGINPFDFAVVDGEGTRYQVGEGSSAMEFGDDALNDANLNPSERIKGTLVFDVPRGDLTLTYAPINQTLATWKVTVK